VSTLAVFSAKKVDPQLFYLLSGESLLNDAVGLVLFEAFAHLIEMESENGDALPLGEEILSVLLDVFLNFGGSLILGVVLGLFAAFLLKKIDLRHTPLLELSAYALIMYAPFVLAEICRLSGIVTVLFTGLAARRYCEPNLSKFTRENSDTIFRLVAHITETVIFLELGLSVITILRHGFDVLFVLSALGACLISRALNIYPLAITFNLVQRLRLGKPPDTKPLMTTTNGSNPSSLGGNDDADEALYTKSDDDSVERVSPLSEQPAVEPLDDAFIPPRTTHFLFLSGLRGAVSYGLVKMFPDNNGNKITFEVTTMLIVLITTFVFGGFTDLALKKLEIPVGVDEDTYMKSLKQSGDATNSTSWWSRFEQKRISPLVLRDFKPAPSDENTGDEFLYQEQAEAEAEAVEMTVEEAAEELSRKKESIYDFGQ
jgi:NhaP-type Na+/H+ or K+/H+ antiporter